MKEFWDFDETKNYGIVNIQGNNYKVIKNFPDYYTAGYILNEIHMIIIKICNYLSLNYYRYTKNDQKIIDCFLQIHPNNYLLSEMQLNTQFYGLNKPRDLYYSNLPGIGSDGKLRSNFRHVFITLRDSNGNFNQFDKIMDLVLHEISHTMCNHVTWKNDNHNKDFKHAEKLLTKVYKRIQN